MRTDTAITKQMSALKRQAGVMPHRGHWRADKDAIRLMEQIPIDNRDLTARVMGDPIYERSALYQYRLRQKGASA